MIVQQYKALLASAGAIISILWQPCIIGQNYGSVIFVLCMVCIFLKIYNNQKVESTPVLIALLFPIYSLICQIIGGETAVLDSLKAFLTVLFGLLTFMIGIREGGVSRTLLKTFVWVMFIVSILGMLTILLRLESILAGNFDFSINTDGYNKPNRFMLPGALFFAQSYYISEFNLISPRFMGLFREPGLMQAFSLTALLCVHFFYRGVWAIAMKSILGIASLLTLSTAAYVNLPIVLIILAFQCKKGLVFKIFTVLSCIALAIVFTLYTLSLSRVGLSEKLENESGIDRIEAFEDGEKTFDRSPLLGSVIKHDSSFEKSKSGGFLMIYSRYGFLGIILLILPFFYLGTREGFMGCMVVISPLLITAIVSQPLLNTVPFLFLLFTVSQFMAVRGKVS
jgi:hypothetical protein